LGRRGLSAYNDAKQRRGEKRNGISNAHADLPDEGSWGFSLSQS
jgi:hypothetical protein